MCRLCVRRAIELFRVLQGSAGEREEEEDGHREGEGGDGERKAGADGEAPPV